MRKFLRLLAIVYLCSVAVFPLLRFLAPGLGGQTLPVYLMAYLLHAALMVFLGWWINKDAVNISRSIFLAGACFFLSGVIYSGAFGMGAPPRDAAEYMTNGDQEWWRGMILIIAAVLTVAGLLIFAYAEPGLRGKPLGNLLALLSVGAAVLTLYDFFWGTFSIPGDIKAWIASGKDKSAFFSSYDMKNEIRGMGRCMIYLSTLVLLFIGWRNGLIITIVSIVLGLLTVFLLQDVLLPLISSPADLNAHIGMVPAVALAPLYFTGIYWISAYRRL